MTNDARCRSCCSSNPLFDPRPGNALSRSGRWRVVGAEPPSFVRQRKRRKSPVICVIPAAQKQRLGRIAHSRHRGLDALLFLYEELQASFFLQDSYIICLNTSDQQDNHLQFPTQLAPYGKKGYHHYRGIELHACTIGAT